MADPLSSVLLSGLPCFGAESIAVEPVYGKSHIQPIPYMVPRNYRTGQGERTAVNPEQSVDGSTRANQPELQGGKRIEQPRKPLYYVCWHMNSSMDLGRGPPGEAHRCTLTCMCIFIDARTQHLLF